MLEIKPSVRDVALALYSADSIQPAREGQQFNTTSGQKTDCFIDVEKAILDPDHGVTILAAFHDKLRELREIHVSPSKLVGVPNGMNIPTAYLTRDLYPLGVSQLRVADIKGHGNEGEIIGGFTREDEAFVLEDIFTTGGSTAETIRRLLANGVNVKGGIGLISKNLYAPDRVRALTGVRVTPLFSAPDIIHAIIQEVPKDELINQKLYEVVCYEYSKPIAKRSEDPIILDTL